MLAVHHTNYPKPTTTDSLDKVPKKKTTKKQRNGAHWKVTAFSYPMLSLVWNQSLKRRLQVFWSQPHSLVMTVWGCLQNLDQSELTLFLLPINRHRVWKPNFSEFTGTSQCSKWQDIRLSGSPAIETELPDLLFPFCPVRADFPPLSIPHYWKIDKNFLQWFIREHVSIPLSCLS